MENSHTSIEFNSNIDLETNFIVCNANISLVNIMTEKTTKIGSAHLYLINTAIYNSWDLIIDHADGISGDLYVISESFNQWLIDEKKVLTNDKVAILDQIKIHKEYRKKGYGKQLINEITSYLSLLSLDYITVYPAPIEVEKDQEQKWKIQKDNLIDFYRKLGFELISDYDDDVVMSKVCL